MINLKGKKQNNDITVEKRNKKHKPNRKLANMGVGSLKKRKK